MENTKTPLRLDGVKENIYAGFWLRFEAGFYDALVAGLFWWLIVYPLTFNGSYFSFVFGQFLYFIFYLYAYIHLVRLIGSSPGKWMTKIKIIRIDGGKVDFRIAFLREIVNVFVILISLGHYIYLWGIIDHAEFIALDGHLKQSLYLSKYQLEFQTILGYVMIPWSLSELVVLLFNKRKRALHDYVADTVVIKKKYESAIREEMGLDVDLEESMG